MSNVNTIRNREEAFLQTYETLVDDFETSGIRHTVIGSLGHAAYTCATLDYDRPARAPAFQIPDIDLLVPRDTLPAARAYREKLASRDAFPVRLGLSIPSYIVDWRPDENYSFLNSTQDTLLQTDLLAPRVVTYRKIAIQTLDPLVLAETYGIFTGRLRAKDQDKADALKRYADESSASDYSSEDLKPFSVHRQLERRHLQNQVIWATGKVHSRLPEAARNAIKPIIQTLVNRAGWR